ncbi:MAG: OsmC family peroxiredoxin [Bacteroidetes bacterium]|jgi:organic hydroperoxide reductase OsmC/OhrA|nr:OsmC family peroxiredoxin [Bacteroidota bacterium]
MDSFPHRYTVAAAADADSDVTLDSENLPSLQSAPPAEFGGPGDRWSPETLLVAAVADCLILTFRSIATANKLAWVSLSCETEGVLDRVDRVTQFTEYTIRATLRIPPETDAEEAHAALERAERVCLITNSLTGDVHLEATVDVAD